MEVLYINLYIYVLPILPVTNPENRDTSYTHAENASTRSRETQLAAGLPCEYLCNRVPDRDTRLLDLLLREASGDAHLECGLELPTFVLAVAVGCGWHTSETGDEHAVGECLWGR